MVIPIYKHSVEMRNGPVQQSWREASQQGSPQGPGSAEGGEAAAKPAASCYPAGRLFLKSELVIQISILGLYLC